MLGIFATGSNHLTLQCLAITNQPIKIVCIVSALSDSPITDGRAEVSDIYLQEEVADGGIRSTTRDFYVKLLREYIAITLGNALQIREDLLLSQDT